MLQLGVPWHDNCRFNHSLVGNLQQNNWCCEMCDHLKGFILGSTWTFKLLQTANLNEYNYDKYNE